MNYKDLRIYVSIADSAVENLLISFLRHYELRVDIIATLKNDVLKQKTAPQSKPIIIVDDSSVLHSVSMGLGHTDAISVILLSNDNKKDRLDTYRKLGVEAIMSYPPKLEAVADKVRELHLDELKKAGATLTEVLIDKEHISAPLSSQHNGLIPKYLTHINTSAVEQIYGKSLAIQHLRDLIEHLSKNDSTVFISGEYGTSIDKVATWLHRKSMVRSHEMANLCCIGLDNHKLEVFFSELEEHISSNVRSNSFVNGSLYISNLQELDEQAQNTFYRNYIEVIQPNLRSNSTVNKGFRVIVSARDSITDFVKKEKFRQDLYDDLHAIPIEVPRLKDRTTDIPLLANKYLQNYMEAYPHYMGKSFAPNAIDYLQSLNWPGNDSELKKKVERVCALVQHPLIMQDDIKLYLKNSANTNQIQNLFEKYDDFQSFKDASERLFLTHFLDKYAWNVSRAADAIKIQRSHLYSKIKKYNIVRD
jgi:DNA-binding NtrC family response regulator